MRLMLWRKKNSQTGREQAIRAMRGLRKQLQSGKKALSRNDGYKTPFRSLPMC